MATVIDITGRIKDEEKFIKWGDKTYKVDDSKNTVLQAQAILASAENANTDTIDEAMKLLIGAKAVKDFSGLSYSDYLVPFYAVMACVQNQTYEETEAQFRTAAQQLG